MFSGSRLFIVIALVGPGTAMAQQPVATPLIDQLAGCLKIVSDTERLRCTDRAARRLVDAARSREVVVVDEQEVKSTRRSLFGFQLPRLGLFGRDGPDKGDDVETIDAKITGVAQLGRGKYAITIDGGARWTTTEAWQAAPYPLPGATATIRKGIMGGYFLKVGNSRAVRAMRTA